MRSAALIAVGLLVVATLALTLHHGVEPQALPAPVEVVQAVPEVAAPTPQRRNNRGRRRREDNSPVVPSIASWTPGEPLQIGLQAGHWKAREAPDELAGIRYNGTSGGGKDEWEVNLEIAEMAADLLRAKGHDVEVLPATVPPSYEAHLFISIHADGHDDSSIHGYRVAASRRDRTGEADDFADLLLQTYGEATGLRMIPAVTRRMQSYYAFNSSRYTHALHPTTPGVIIETGFLTSPADRAVIVDSQARSAKGIADAVDQYLEALKVRSPRLAAR